MNAADAQPTSLRQHRPFAFYWVSRVSSTVALQMQAVAVAWQMYEITNNPLDLGLVGLIQFIPAVLFVLVAGHIADRYDRRTIVRVCQTVSGLAAATLAIGTAGGWMTRESLLAVVFVTGSARAFEQTTLIALLPRSCRCRSWRVPRRPAHPRRRSRRSAGRLSAAFYAVNPVLVYALCATLYITSSF